MEGKGTGTLPGLGVDRPLGEPVMCAGEVTRPFLSSYFVGIDMKIYIIGLFVLMTMIGAMPEGYAQVGHGSGGGRSFTLDTLLSGEDQTNNVLRVEFQNSVLNTPATADVQIKAVPGYVDSLICTGTDGTATAGTIILYDNTAESGTILYQLDVQAVAYTNPVVIPLHAVASVGLYLGFTTTADMRCVVVGR